MLRRIIPLALIVTLFTVVLAPASARAEVAVGVTSGPGGYAVATFDPDSGATFTIRGISGLGVFVPVGLDVRPATGSVYLLGANDQGGANDTQLQLFLLTPETGAATAVGAPVAAMFDDGRSWGIDFNPVADRLRVINTGAANSNVRINPDTGVLVATDSAIAGTTIAAVGYDRSVAGATVTTAFGIDHLSDVLVRIGGVDGVPSPNTGSATTIGALGVDLGSTVNLDISPNTGTAYASNASALYRVNLTTGAATALPTAYDDLLDFAILPNSTIQVAPATVTASETSSVATVTVTRTGSTVRAATVDLATSAGTATSGSDFVATSGSLSFAAGVTSRTVNVPLVNDSVVETDETFSLTLSAPTGQAQLGAASIATVTVASDDVTVTVTDSTAPVVLLNQLVNRTNAQLRRFGQATVYSCSEACTTTLTLRLGTTVIGTATRSINGAGVARVIVKPSTRGATLLTRRLAASRSGRATVTLTLVATDATGNVATTRASFAVRR